MIIINFFIFFINCLMIIIFTIYVKMINYLNMFIFNKNSIIFFTITIPKYIDEKVPVILNKLV